MKFNQYIKNIKPAEQSVTLLFHGPQPLLLHPPSEVPTMDGFVQILVVPLYELMCICKYIQYIFQGSIRSIAKQLVFFFDYDDFLQISVSFDHL